MEEYKDTTSNKGCECQVNLDEESLMEEETVNVHPTPIIVDTLNENLRGGEEVKW